MARAFQFAADICCSQDAPFVPCHVTSFQFVASLPQPADREAANEKSRARDQRYIRKSAANDSSSRAPIFCESLITLGEAPENCIRAEVLVESYRQRRAVSPVVE